MDDNKTQREQRLAAALRANLQRRKQQARRPVEPDTSPEAFQDSGSAAGEAPDTGGSGGKT